MSVPLILEVEVCWLFAANILDGEGSWLVWLELFLRWDQGLDEVLGIVNIVYGASAVETFEAMMSINQQMHDVQTIMKVARIMI
jgi:hypothetical protein